MRPKVWRRFTIDGTTADNCLDESSKVGPFAVFDATKQDWLVTGVRFRWWAKVIAFFANVLSER